MTSLTDTQVVTASGGLVELGYSQVTSSVSLGTTLTNVTSTLTVVCDGGPILVEFYAPSARCFGTDNMSIALFEDGVQKAEPWGESVGSASTVAATPVYLTYRLSPSAGSHTYQVRARSNQSQQIRAGSGGTGSPAYAPAFIRVSKIVRATQWPAVTTGTIICTSTTRPASPFEGQRIYETDTNREFIWDGANWYSPGLQASVSSTTATQSVTATTTDITGLSVTWTAVPSRVYKTSIYVPNGYPSTGSYPAVYITDGSNNRKQFSSFLLQSGVEATWVCSVVESGLSGSVTRKGRLSVNSGTFTIRAGADYPHQLIVEDIGPA